MRGYVRFSASDASPTELLFDAGADCALIMGVQPGAARLAYTPQLCGSGDATARQYTAAEVTGGNQLAISEAYSDGSGCAYQLYGILTR